MAENQFTAIQIASLQNIATELMQSDVFHIQRNGIDYQIPASLVRSSGTEETGDAWDSTVTYSTGDIVSRFDTIFISQQDNNLNQSPNPNADTDYWHSATRSESNGGLGVYATGLYTIFSLVFDTNDGLFYYTDNDSLPFESTSLQTDVNEGRFILLETSKIQFVSSLPTTGNTEILYINTTDNTLHIWTGTAYEDLGGADLRPLNNVVTVSADAQTVTINGEEEQVYRYSFDDGVETFIIAFSNISSEDEYRNKLIIDNSSNDSGLTVTLNDNSGAITFENADNDFPGTSPNINIPANTKWTLRFENESNTLIYINYIER